MRQFVLLLVCTFAAVLALKWLVPSDAPWSDVLLPTLSAAFTLLLGLVAFNLTLHPIENGQLGRIRGYKMCFVALCVLSVGTTYFQSWRSYQSQKQASEASAEKEARLLKELSELRSVHPLRREAAKLATEMLNFVQERHATAMKGVVPGTTLTEHQTKRVMQVYGQAVRDYRHFFEPRLLVLRREISNVTKQDTMALEQASKNVDGQAMLVIEEVANRLSAIAASLP